jgi:hypothetical protein
MDSIAGFTNDEVMRDGDSQRVLEVTVISALASPEIVSKRQISNLGGRNEESGKFDVDYKH